MLLYRAIERTLFKYNLDFAIYLFGVPISYLASYGIHKISFKLFHVTISYTNELVKLLDLSIFALPSSFWLIFIYRYAGKLSWFNSIKLSLISALIVISVSITLGSLTPHRNIWLFPTLFILYLILTVYEKIKKSQSNIPPKRRLVPVIWELLDWFFRWGILIICSIIKVRFFIFFLIFLKLRSVLYNKLSIHITDDGFIYKNHNINWTDITSITYNYGLTIIGTSSDQITIPGLPESTITKIVTASGLNHYSYLHHKTIITKTPDALLVIQNPGIKVKFIAFLQCILFLFMCLLFIVDALIGDISNLYMRIILSALACSFLKNELYELERASFRDALARLSALDFTITHEGIHFRINDNLIRWENITSINKSLATILITPAIGEQFKIPNNQFINQLVDDMYTKNRLNKSTSNKIMSSQNKDFIKI